MSSKESLNYEEMMKKKKPVLETDPHLKPLVLYDKTI